LVKQFYSTGVWRGDLTRRDLSRTSLRYFIPPALVLSILLGSILGGLGFIVGWVPVLGYLGAIVAVGFLAGLAPVPLVLATMHLSWGVGFILGYLRGAAGTIDRSRVTK
jgi:hypothetical protein